jgi:hypothetical protein
MRPGRRGGKPAKICRTTTDRRYGVLALLIALVVVVVVLLLVGRIGLRWRSERQVLTFGGAEPVRRAEIEVAAGPVAIIGTDAGPVRVERAMRWLGARLVTTEEVSGGVLRIQSLHQRRAWPRGEVGYRVELPATASVRVTSGAGEIAVQGVDGDVELEARAGRVALAELSGDLRASSQAGAIDGTGLACQRVEVSSNAGTVTLAFVRPPQSVELRTGAGIIELLVPEERYRIHASSSAGRVEVALPSDPTAERRLEAHSNAGAVAILRR